MSLFAIGDIHGYTKAVSALLDYVAPSSDDTVVFLGDYVDKGPDVCGTLDYLIACSSHTNRIFLRGNHDQMFLDAKRDESAFEMWECLSGKSPLRSYGQGAIREVFDSIPEEHFHFLENRCVDFYETDNYIFVHGGISPHIKPEDEAIDRLQWTTLGMACEHLSLKTVICGHSSQLSGKIADLGHTICIDTGIAKGNFVTCLNLDDFSYAKADADGGIATGRLRPRETT